MVPDWLITSHVTYTMSSDWLFTAKPTSNLFVFLKLNFLAILSSLVRVSRPVCESLAAMEISSGELVDLLGTAAENK